MNRHVKSVLKRFVRTPLVSGFQTRRPSLRRARSAFEAAGAEPAWLGYDQLAHYQRKYAPPADYGYDLATLARRGEDRANEMMRWHRSKTIRTTLEIGCWDGMASAALQSLGKSAVGVDYRSEGFDARARRAGVQLIEMDARQLEFADDTFDFAFSYNSFEHFEHAEEVLGEAIRVLRPGGFLYLDFGPLYMSPLGAHLYRQITVPYCRLLFSKDVLLRFADERGLGALDFDGVNGYTLQDFRNLWARHASRLHPVRYYEHPNVSHVGLIQRHPSCFKSKTNHFDNLIVTQIVALFQKRV